MTNNCFVYLVFGNAEIYYLEALFSISSLRATVPDSKILVVSSKPEYFKNIQGLSTVHLTDSLKAQWLGNCSYAFNLKLHALAHVLENYHERLIFLDTDTIVRRDLRWCFEVINEKNAFLHVLEGTLSMNTFKRGYAQILGNTINYGDGKSITLTGETPMYNSGVIGVHKAHAPLLKEAALLAQAIDKHTNWHTAEQLALGILLKQNGELHVIGNKPVKHYWHKQYKRFIREQLVANYCDLQQMDKENSRLKLRRTIPRWCKDKMSKIKPLTNDLCDYR